MVNSSVTVSWRALAWLLIAVVAVWAASGLVLHSFEERGTFGDMFGAVNALFSGLAFATLIYTIHLQRHELSLQRQELSLTRAEIEGQKIQLAAQNELMQAGNFESSFFRVLGILADIVNAMDVPPPHGGPLIRGRDCFSHFYGQLRGKYNHLQPQLQTDNELEIIQAAYAAFYKRSQGDVGHYFRTLYNLVKLVDRSYVTDKRFYTNLIRAQLSSNELSLLFYNCLSDLGREKFKPLVEKYALLKTVPRETLIRPHHIQLYVPGALGEG